MALGVATNKIFLSVADGKIVQKVTDATPGSIPRTKKDGAIVYEMRYANITGILIGISTRTNTYQGKEIKEWQFDINDGSDNYQVQMMFDSKYATSLLFALANPAVDLAKPITITPWMKVVDDKKKTSCYLKQGETAIDWFFTRDNPNGMPELKEVIFQGKKQWDGYDRMVFLENYVNNMIKPRLNNPFAVTPQAAATNYAPASIDDRFLGTDQGEEDDLPF